MKKVIPCEPSDIEIKNPWRSLRKFTDARIGLGRAGNSIPTECLLKFQMDHANARDAVHIPLDRTALASAMPSGINCILVQSQANDRSVYLQRPDLGRSLAAESAHQLRQYYHQKVTPNSASSRRAVLLIADGLSSVAVQTHAADVTKNICTRLKQSNIEMVAICLASQGRVALGDEVAQILKAELLIVLIGERPGLSSPDSLGIYYTYKPSVGMQDSGRNCISNIRPAGLSFEEAADKLIWLIEQSIHIQQSGVMLKDQSDPLPSEATLATKNILLG